MLLLWYLTGHYDVGLTYIKKSSKLPKIDIMKKDCRTKQIYLIKVNKGSAFQVFVIKIGPCVYNYILYMK